MKVTIRIRNVFAYIFNNIVQIRAYALMALGRNNKKDTLPSVYDIRLLDGGIVMALCFSIIFHWHNCTLAWITLAVYFICGWFMDFENGVNDIISVSGIYPIKQDLDGKSACGFS